MAAHTYLAIFQSVTGNARSIPTFELRELVSSALFAVFGGFWMERGVTQFIRLPRSTVVQMALTDDRGMGNG